MNDHRNKVVYRNGTTYEMRYTLNKALFQQQYNEFTGHRMPEEHFPWRRYPEYMGCPEIPKVLAVIMADGERQLRNAGRRDTL